MRRFGTRGKARGFEQAPSVAQNRVLRLVPRGSAAFRRPSVNHGPHLSGWVASCIALDAHARSGGGLGLSRSIRRRISANRARGTANSASWNHVAAVAHDPGADLDQLLAQRRERPMLDLLRQGQRAQEVDEFVRGGCAMVAVRRDPAPDRAAQTKATAGMSIGPNDGQQTSRRGASIIDREPVQRDLTPVNDPGIGSSTLGVLSMPTLDAKELAFLRRRDPNSAFSCRHMGNVG